MSANERFLGPVLSSAEGETVFAGCEQKSRMDLVRRVIFKIRKAWLDTGEYNQLREAVRQFVRPERQPRVLREVLNKLLSEYRDYADVDAKRPTPTNEEQYTALELYCSDEGYSYLYTLLQKTLRLKDVPEEQLLATVTFVEWVTIDLYNLRASNIGDPIYRNYEGTTYRGMRVPQRVIDDYQEVAKRPDLTTRSFSIPLGMTSSSADSGVTEHFTLKHDKNLDSQSLLWTIHVRGLDPSLLQAYLTMFPDSVVTSICAMPIARLSPYGEKEVLLRGAFFHIIRMGTRMANGRQIHELEVVMINSNRDHTSEQGSNEGEKRNQRDLFSLIVAASRYEACVSLVGRFDKRESEQYRILQELKINEIRNFVGHHNIRPNLSLGSPGSNHITTWLGGTTLKSYPRHYTNLRYEWQNAGTLGQWSKILNILEREYDTRRLDWFHVGPLDVGDDSISRAGLTLLHEMARQGPPAPNSPESEAWDKLIKLVDDGEAWKTLRTFDERSMTAQEIAAENSYSELAMKFMPNIILNVDSRNLMSIQEQLHNLMREMAGPCLQKDNARLPQLSVLMEMNDPELWVPIPHMFGGFLVRLVDSRLSVELFETVIGQHQARKTTFWLEAK